MIQSRAELKNKMTDLLVRVVVRDVMRRTASMGEVRASYTRSVGHGPSPGIDRDREIS